jgi:hypothetical protein
MAVRLMSALFAQTTNNNLPTGKAVAMIVFFGAVVLTSLAGLFASRERLESMSGVIGTKNPLVARIVCAIALLISSGAVLAGVLSLLGKM